MSVFRFKQFAITQSESAMKVGTDAMLLGAIAFHTNPTKILDIGAGTGVLSLMMAQKYKDAHVDAVEIDPPSAKECQANFTVSDWSDRCAVHCVDFLKFQSNNLFDCIVSNPPYYQSRLENVDLRKAQARHEAALPVGEMLQHVKSLLSAQGAFWVIVPMDTQSDWLEKAEEKALFCTEEVVIYGKQNAIPKRCILCFRHFRSERSSSNLSVRDEDGRYTQQYIALTSQFHFNDLRGSGSEAES